MHWEAPGVSGLGRAIGLFTGSSIIGSLTQVAKGKLSALLLGAAGVGIVSQLTTMFSLVSTVSGFGFYNGMARHMAQHWRKEEYEAFRTHMSSSACFLFASALFFSILGCLFSAEISDTLFDDAGERRALVCIVLIATPFFVMGQVYRAMLNATRSVNWLVKARITADVLSVIALAIFLWFFGIVGAILGFISLHALFLATTMWATRKAIGLAYVAPKPASFAKAEIRRNVGFGINGLIAVATGIITTLIVSRWIITDLGATENGLFAMAFKVGTVYLGGLSAAAGGYYFPTMAASETDEEMFGHVNGTLKLYLFIIAPAVVVLMAGGDVMMYALFSAEFVPAAALLLLMLPADLFRITSETVGLALIAKKRLVTSTSFYLIWASTYSGLALYLMPDFGLVGVATAYFLSQLLNAIFLLCATRAVLGYRMSSDCAWALIRGVSLVCYASAALQLVDNRWLQYGLCSLGLIAWFAASMRDTYFQNLVSKALNKFRHV